MVEYDKSYRMATLEVLRPNVATFVQHWNGLKRQLDSDEMRSLIPPLQSATWVWELSPIIKSMLMSHVRDSDEKAS